MFENIGFGELLVIALFILIFFGPKKIPDIARTLGKAVREFRKAMQDVQSEIQIVTGIDLNSEINQISSEVKELADKPIERANELDDLKFVKQEEQIVEKSEQIIERNELSKGRNNSAGKKTKMRSSSRVKVKSRSGVKTKSKER